MAGKVGVLTFHRSFNYGSYWQARCLVEALHALGHEAELLDHDSDGVNRAEARCLLQPTLPLRSPRSDLPAYARKGRKIAAAVGALPLSARFPLDSPQLAPACRSIVVGSDEVWNFRHPWFGGQRLFFGGDLGPDRLVSYAASFGNHDATERLDPYWSDLLARFDALSVRDENSRSLVKAATGRDPDLVLDPVLLHPRAIVPSGGREAARYALVYGHGFPDWLTAQMTRWSRLRGLVLLSVGYRNDWADEQRLDAGPDEFAGLMAGAAAVVTNFFHGCVFALVNERPWIAAPSPYRANKIRDLAAALDAGAHVVGEGVDDEHLDAMLTNPPAAAVAGRIAELRERSRAFLQAAVA